MAVRSHAHPCEDAAQGHQRDRQHLWIVLAGWWLALSHLLVGCLLCITIIGIPLGVASFKMAGAALAPFGKEIVKKSDLTISADAIAV
jgi:uncharacterized membrane protein YccF (DUF307 family)